MFKTHTVVCVCVWKDSPCSWSVSLHMQLVGVTEQDVRDGMSGCSAVATPRRAARRRRSPTALNISYYSCKYRGSSSSLFHVTFIHPLVSTAYFSQWCCQASVVPVTWVSGEWSMSDRCQKQHSLTFLLSFLLQLNFWISIFQHFLYFVLVCKSWLL